MWYFYGTSVVISLLKPYGEFCLVADDVFYLETAKTILAFGVVWIHNFEAQSRNSDVFSAHLKLIKEQNHYRK